jgi:putative ABC transport system permease protein
LENLWKDIRFGLRSLVRSPATTLVALLTLALGIGANSAIFSVVDGVLLKPLPYDQPDELVIVWESAPKLGFPRFSVAPPNFADWWRSTASAST